MILGEGAGLIPGQGAKISHAVQYYKKKKSIKKKKKAYKYLQYLVGKKHQKMTKSSCGFVPQVNLKCLER